MDVGVRELRDGLSRHLASVRDGHTVTVTDHGRPVARIIPVGTRNRLETLIAEGKVRPPQGRRGDPPKTVRATGTVSDLVAEQRG